jgi:hypothetical protein
MALLISREISKEIAALAEAATVLEKVERKVAGVHPRAAD